MLKLLRFACEMPEYIVNYSSQVCRAQVNLQELGCRSQKEKEDDEFVNSTDVSDMKMTRFRYSVLIWSKKD